MICIKSFVDFESKNIFIYSSYKHKQYIRTPQEEERERRKRKKRKRNNNNTYTRLYLLECSVIKIK